MQFNNYVRHPFLVEAVEITEDNIQEVADLIGELQYKDGVPYIRINRRIIPNMGRAEIGWVLTRLDDNYRCYAPNIFAEQFVIAKETMQFDFELGGTPTATSVVEAFSSTANPSAE